MSPKLRSLRKWFAGLTAITILATLFVPLASTLAVDTGFLNVNVRPNDATYNIEDGNGQLIPGSPFTGDAQHELEVGSYNVVFLPHPDPAFTTPASEEVLILPNDQVTVTGSYTDDPVLSVNVNPEDGDYIIEDGNGQPIAAEPFEGDQSFVGLTLGSYTVRFLDHPNFAFTPAPVEVLLLSDSIITVTGNYSNAPPAQEATLQVTTSPIIGEVLINGVSAGFPTPGNPINATVNTDEDNTISFGTVAGFNTPSDIFLPANTLAVDSANSYEGVYVDTDDAATLLVSTTPVTGEVFVNGVSNGLTLAADTPLQIPVDVNIENTISFGDVANYNTPADIVIPASTLAVGSGNAYTGVYLLTANAATLEVNTAGADGEVFVDGVSIGTSVAGAFVSTAIDVTAEHTITFGTVVGFTAPADITIPANTVTAGTTHQETGTYLQNTDATLEVFTENAAGEVFVNGTSIGIPAAAGQSVQTTIDITVQNDISFGPVAGFTAPADITVPANTVVAGTTHVETGTYVQLVTATLNITTLNAAGEILVDGVSLGTPANPGDILTTDVDVTADHTISFGAVAGFTTPNDIFIPADTLLGGSTNPFSGVYIVDANAGTLQVQTTPVAAEVLLNGLSVGSTPAADTFIDLIVDVTVDNTLSFGPVFGFTTPADIVVTGGTIAAGGTHQETGTYIDVSATLEVNTLNADGEVFVNGTSIGTSVAGAFVSTTIDTTVQNTISFGAVAGFNAPADIVIAANAVNVGDTHQETGIYLDQNNIATIEVNTLNTDGEVFVNGTSIGTSVAGAFVSTTIDVTATNTISFGADLVNGFIAPNDILLPADSLTGGSTTQYSGEYIDPANAATVQVATDPVTGEVFVNGLSRGFTANPGQFIDVEIDVTVTNTVSFGAVAGFISPNDFVIGANTLALGAVVQHTGVYVDVNNAATLEVNTINADGQILVDGNIIGTSVAGAFVNTAIDVTVDNTISFSDVAGFTTPAPITITAGTLNAGDTHQETGTYQLITTATLDITTNPVAGEILVDGVSLGTPANPGDILTTDVDITQDHTISFGAVAGFTTPGDIFIPANTLVGASTNTFEGLYIADTDSAVVQVQTTPIVGEILLNGSTKGFTPAPDTFINVVIDATVDNTISFGAVANYATPGDIVITANTLNPGDVDQQTGTYVLIAATLEVTTVNVDGEVFVNGASIGTSVAGAPVTTTIDVTQVNTISFGAVAGFLAPADITLPANTITAGTTEQQTGTYIDLANVATLEVNTAGADGEVFVDGVSIGTSVSGAFVSTQIDVTVSHTISFGAVAGFTAPADITLTAGTITGGTTHQETGTYTPNTADITVTTSDDAVFPGTPGGVANAEIFLEDIDAGTPAVSLGTGEVTANINADTNYRITFSGHPTDPTYTTPAPIFFNLVGGETRTYLGQYVHSCTVNLNKEDSAGGAVAGEVFVSIDGSPEFSLGTGDPANNFVVTHNADETRTTVYRFALPSPNPGNLQVPAPDTFTVPAGTDPATCPLNVTAVYQDPATDKTLEVATNGADGEVFVNGASIGTSVGGAFVVTTIDVTVENTISFGAVTRFTTPANIVIDANTLTAGAPAHQEIGVYVPAPEVTVTKTPSATTAADNDVITYAITLERTNDTINGGGPLAVTVSDSIEADDAVYGVDGGELRVILGNGDCTVVGGGGCVSQLIYENPIDVTLGAFGSIATITYETRASNQFVFQGGANSIATNTVTVTSADLPADITATADVGLIPLPIINTGGGTPVVGSGGGGGPDPITGDMQLVIEKLVSFDGVTFERADIAEKAVVVPENKTTTVFHKVRITNLGKVSATNIKFKHTFDTGLSDMTADEPDQLTGGEWNKAKTHMVVDKVKVNETVEMTYRVLVHEHGQNSNPAVDHLELTEFKSALPNHLDSLTYLGLGDNFSTVFYAGRIPANVNSENVGTSPTTDSLLLLELSADTGVAGLGQNVGFTARVRNISDRDLTDLFLANSFDPAVFTVESTAGAIVKQNELHWKRGVLRPGQAINLPFTLRVNDNAPVGPFSRAVFRATVSQQENVAPASVAVRISESGISAIVPGREFELAATGPAGILMMLLMALASTALYPRVQNAIYRRRKVIALNW